MLRSLTQVYESALDLVFPPRCCGCGQIGALLCSGCQSQIEAAPPVTRDASPLAGVAAFGAHTGALRKAIHHLKFNHETRFAAVLAPLLAQTLQKSGWDVTLITGIPLSAQRQAERGYNQASLLANELARIVRRSCSERLVVRTRETQSQVGLGFADRQVNMKGAFQADSTLAQGQRVLIVDDVFTTGATLRNCGQALYSAGAACVWGLTVACAIPRPDSSGDLDHEP